MKLFVSHAWEDKEFAKPLADALRAAGYEVWFDEYAFRLGDSLLGKINEGILAADFGVVVFSRDYLRKFWTRTELDGLAALEARHGKMILPVWHNMTPAAISESMPTMAGRYAVTTEHGLERVVAEIRTAIEGADRQRELALGASAKSRIQKLSADRKARKDADQLLYSMHGATTARTEAAKVQAMAEQVFAGMSTEEHPFNIVRDGEFLDIQVRPRLHLRIHYVDGASNSAEDAVLECHFYQQGTLQPFGGRSPARAIDHQRYWPYFGARGIPIWCSSKERDSGIETEILIDRLADSLAKLVERETR